MDRTFSLGQVITAGAIGLWTGYLIARASTRTKPRKDAASPVSKEEKSKSTREKKPAAERGQDSNKGDQIEEDSEEYNGSEEDSDFTEEDTEDEGNDELAELDLNEEYKMVLVVRTDLAMGKGKAAAQCCHATLANYKELNKKTPKMLTRWEYCGQAKVTLKIDNEEDMLLLQATARSLGLAANSIRDAGRTQIAAGSRTVLAVGPGPVSVVDTVTGKLKLY
ncbi:Peptidyl-tRNA hydrolase protein 2, mitochondrial [Lunasporangiospora selenospora]|uniref:peptidyl-tRNA hydrolase n=1 Tax=Lunasporangiospora selenospora TaxID=979761 RepID=A0A9P6KJ76_9FUNG|nr:Peptidyl-tRNA hydrolase protein 2, mitochondrial [Lunasporangiospora selenospora]